MPKGILGRPTILCPGCNTEKPHRAGGMCAGCYNRWWRATYPDRAKASTANWRETHQEQLAATQARYREQHRDEHRIASRRWNNEHLERLKVTTASWRAANPERVRASDARKYERHRDKILEASRRRWLERRDQYRAAASRWYESHRDDQIRKAKEWKQEHPESARVSRHRRKSLARTLPNTLTIEQWAAIVAAYKGRCAYCGRKPKKLTQDHVVPVKKGGGYTAENIVPACQPCNSKKSAGPPLKAVQTMML